MSDGPTTCPPTAVKNQALSHSFKNGTRWPLGAPDSGILHRLMPTDRLPSQPSFEDRRQYYRINVVLPVSIQGEMDTREGELISRSINLSGGGIGVTVNVLHHPNEILLITLLLPDRVIFKAYAEVLRSNPIAQHVGTYRLHARFIRMTAGNRELLIRYVLRFQRDHLAKHYSV